MVNVCIKCIQSGKRVVGHIDGKCPYDNVSAAPSANSITSSLSVKALFIGDTEAVKKQAAIRLGSSLSKFEGTQEWADIESIFAKYGYSGDDLPTAISDVVISCWAVHSTNTPITGAIQEAAKEFFGLDRVSYDESYFEWEWEEHDSIYESLDRSLGEDTADQFMENIVLIVEELEGLWPMVVEAQYESTQTFLEEQGISEIKLERGLVFQDLQNIPPDEVQSFWDEVPEGNEDEVVLHLKPEHASLSSWSSNRDIAESFTEPDSPDWPHAKVLISKTVSSENIFSLPQTGFGCLNEEEFIVVGNDDSEEQWHVDVYNVKP